VKAIKAGGVLGFLARETQTGMFMERFIVLSGMRRICERKGGFRSEKTRGCNFLFFYQQTRSLLIQQTGINVDKTQTPEGMWVPCASRSSGSLLTCEICPEVISESIGSRIIRWVTSLKKTVVSGCYGVQVPADPVSLHGRWLFGVLHFNEVIN
jgi:hypothetical protein